MGLKEVPKGPLREGFTTGTAATAAAKAGLWAILNQKSLESIQVHLPIDKVLDIKIEQLSFTENTATCTVIKDAGDDPDVTNGAHIGCHIRLIAGREVLLKGGEGVGTVTLPGLELAVGEPAINPTPRKMIRAAVGKLLSDTDMECGVEVEVFIKDGKALAKRTLNERVGIMNGLSVLGTTGIVKPYSSSSYIASIEQGIDVAVANGHRELVINSGARSEKYLRVLFPNLPEQGFIHYGNWIGETLKKVKVSPIQKITIGIMLGKAVKLAKGNTDTHSCVASWDKDFIATIAHEVGYDKTVQQEITALNMAGRLVELFPFQQKEIFYQQLLHHCFTQINLILDNTTVDLYLIGKNGEFIQYEP